MNKSTKLAILLSLALTAAVSRPASAATIEEQISERLNSVERENAELKQRLKLIESSVAKSGHALPRAASRQNPPQAAEPAILIRIESDRRRFVRVSEQ